MQRNDGMITFRFSAQEGQTYRIAAVLEPQAARQGHYSDLRAELKSHYLSTSSETVLVAPATIELAVTTSERLDAIESVDLLRNGEVFVTLSGPPFIYRWTN